MSSAGTRPTSARGRNQTAAKHRYSETLAHEKVNQLSREDQDWRMKAQSQWHSDIFLLCPEWWCQIPPSRLYTEMFDKAMPDGGDIGEEYCRSAVALLRERLTGYGGLTSPTEEPFWEALDAHCCPWWFSWMPKILTRHSPCDVQVTDVFYRFEHQNLCF